MDYLLTELQRMIIHSLPRPGTTFRATLLAGLAILLVACGGQPLDPWHTVSLAEEYDVRSADEIVTFQDYLALEDRLFAEVLDKVYPEVDTGPEFQLVRYSAGSAADPETREPNYNRTFELPAGSPTAGVLLLHGMSDSPYSLRTLGHALNRQGYWVIGLRLPGHGTIPAGLRQTRWEDMAAAVQLAAAHLAEQTAGKPLHIIGYSTGSTLALNHALQALDNPDIRMPGSLVLVSPAIGISRAAALAGPKATLSRAPGLGRFSYTAIDPEFDPYKYNSFATNAGSQVHRLTRSVASRIASLQRSGEGNRVPPILVFKSAVDATVSVDAVVDNLLNRLPDQGNELVLFDINRDDVNSLLIVSDPGPITERLMADDSLPFGITFVTNERSDSDVVVSQYKPPLNPAVTRIDDLGLSWPPGVISLSHVALPFAPDDPLYGRFPPDEDDELFLGQMEMRGERGLLSISPNWLVRIRYNPFYSVLEQRVMDWMALHTADD